MASKSENDSELEKLLQSLSGPLRHELSRLRIMGEVPLIYFVQGNVYAFKLCLTVIDNIVFLDKTYANIAAVDRLLNKADFGDDFIPSCSTLLYNHPVVFTSIDPQIRVIIIVIICLSFIFYTFNLFQEKIKELEGKENLEEGDEMDVIPKMKMDVMGLDHSAIMARVRF